MNFDECYFCKNQEITEHEYSKIVIPSWIIIIKKMLHTYVAAWASGHLGIQVFGFRVLTDC